MLRHIIRGLFLAVFISLALVFIIQANIGTQDNPVNPFYGAQLWIFLAACLGAVLVTIGEYFIPRKGIATLSGVFFGLLVGLLISYVLGLIVDTVAVGSTVQEEDKPVVLAYVQAVKVLLSAVVCFLCVSFVVRTKDDFRFVIPYVEFAKQTKGARPMILDTSVIIDGRIADISETYIIDSPLIIPRFVLQELQNIADSADRLKRKRGRRGLDKLNELQRSDKVDVIIQDTADEPEGSDEAVDIRLLNVARRTEGRLVTNDYNLNRIAKLRGVPVININDLAGALRPVVLPGEQMNVRVIKDGDQPGQGVGYLEDGTMVVVEQGRDYRGQEVRIVVTSVLQTSAGRMIFGKMEGLESARSRK
jgi:uncharacterized protein YacL